MAKNVLVTGGTGFIGRTVVDQLAERDYGVESFDRSHGSDVLNKEQLREAMSDKQHVIHLAGVLGTDELFNDAHRAIDVNIHGTLNVLEVAQEVGAGYTGIIMPQVWRNVYQTTKNAAQNFAEAWHEQYGLPVSHVRAFNAFGPYQKVSGVQKILPTFATRAWRGEPIPVWGDGEQTVDLVHSRDVARMLIDAMDFGQCEVFDAGTGVEFTVNQVVDMVRTEADNSDSPIEYLPMRRGEKAVSIVAKGEGWDLLSWRPRFSIADLSDTVHWYKRDRP
ncbi:MAG TPA: NAD(P)-dependent oxidoreductase [Anaerolineales bacterium]|nr:NAD(P)-dependent oxidoreductase [Anaerolineales bacterium]